MISQIIFLFLSVAGFYFAFRQFKTIREKIFLGKPIEQGFDDKNERWKQVGLIALGQKKMFKRLIPAVLHLFIYVAFLFTQIELIEILIDGITGKHRIFAPFLGGIYTLLINTIEILSVLALVATIIFLVRRNLLKVPRLVMSEMNGWPKLDGNIILYLEILLIIGIFSMNSADGLLQTINPDKYPDTGNLLISNFLGSSFLSGLSASSLAIIERFGWWLHYAVVLGFLNYLPISKHLHVVLAFPNTWFNSIENRGEMSNMPEIMNEVKSLMGLIEESEMPAMDAELPEFGAKDVTDLPWTDVLAAYTCTECGRCTSVCPANMTGKKLSPRKIMMDVRDRADQVYAQKNSGQTELENPIEGSLFDFISSEELHACTTCNACVEACPVLINPMKIILDLRRYEILTLSEGPKDWLPLFTSIENSGSAWQIAEERIAWSRD